MEISGHKRLRIAGICSLLFLVSLSLTAYSVKNPAIARIGTTIVHQVIYPFQAANHTLTSSIKGIWNNYINLIHVKEDNRELRERLRKIQVDNAKLAEIEVENANLREALQIVKKSKMDGWVANVVGYNATQWTQLFTLDRGLEDGVQVGMPVLFGESVVGQILSVSLGSSRVLLLTDPSSGIDAVLQRSRARGVVRGLGQNACIMRFVAAEEEVKVGDLIVSSGMDGIYPKGFLIGTVSDVSHVGEALFHTIKVKTRVNFSKIETVFIARERS